MSPFILALPIISIFVGAIFAHQHDVSYSAFDSNLIGFFIGIVLATGMRFLGKRCYNLSGLFAISALIAMTLTLFFSGIDGVHRWIPIGPINLNASMAFTPLILAAIYRDLKCQRPLFWVLLLWALTLHTLQPDKGQALAFSVSVIFVIINSIVPTKVKIGAVFISFLGAGLAWIKADTLEAIPHVESILHLIGGFGLIGITLSVICIVTLFIPFIWIAFKSRTEVAMKSLAMAFTIYFAGQFIATELGNFPVPIIGAGAAPVIGWCLALGSVWYQRGKALD